MEKDFRLTDLTEVIYNPRQVGTDGSCLAPSQPNESPRLFVPGTGELPANFSGAADILTEENGNGRKEHRSKVNQGEDRC